MTSAEVNFSLSKGGQAQGPPKYAPGGVPENGATNDSGVIENADFQGFRTLRLRHLRNRGQHSIISSLVAFLLTRKYMTLNDLEWSFSFCVKFSLFTDRQTDRRTTCGCGSFCSVLLSLVNALNGHITLNFHYYELPVKVII